MPRVAEADPATTTWGMEWSSCARVLLKQEGMDGRGLNTPTC
ncbi:hypothetical protein [Streptomyces sp. TRM68367]|nr:hypothetical protein [Streptomyces sp. TRM68367]